MAVPFLNVLEPSSERTEFVAAAVFGGDPALQQGAPCGAGGSLRPKKQTHQPAEILVVDDGSRDGGDDLVRAFNSPLIKLSRRTEPGPGGYAARNMAVRAASSEWIAFLDADDEWLPGHLQNLARAIDAREAGPAISTAFAGYSIVFPNGMTQHDRYSKRTGPRGIKRFDLGDLLRVWLALDRCPIWTSATACRRTALLDAGLFPEGRCRRGGDKDMWVRVVSQGAAVSAPGISAIYYRGTEKTW